MFSSCKQLKALLAGLALPLKVTALLSHALLLAPAPNGLVSGGLLKSHLSACEILLPHLKAIPKLSRISKLFYSECNLWAGSTYLTLINM